MRKPFFTLAVLIGCTAAFSTSPDTVSSFPRIFKSKLTMYHLPDVVTTNASGEFTTQIAFQGKIIDSTRLKKALDDVNLTIPYYDQSLTALTDKYGEFVTTKIPASGTVVNTANEPIAGAWVTIKAKLFKDSADSNGMLSNGGTIGTIVPFTSWRQRLAGAVLSGNRLFVAANSGQRIDVSLFTMKGERCFYGSIDKLSDKSRTLKMHKIATGSYVLNVTFGGKSVTIKRPFFSGNDIIVQQYAPKSSTASGTFAKRSAETISDTLVAFANGYLAAYLPLPNGEFTGLKITLEASDPWKPASATELEHQGNMVKIVAKDHNFSMGQPFMLLDDITTTNWKSEGPAHKVSFTYDFWMDSTEVTQKQFSDITKAAYKVVTYTYAHTYKVLKDSAADSVLVTDTLRSNNYSTNLDSIKALEGVVLVATDSSSTLPQPTWTSGYGLGDNIPGYYLSYGDAIMFCNARSKAEQLDTVYSYSACINSPGKLCALIDLSIDMSENGYRLPTEAEWEYACRGGTETDFSWNKNFFNYPSTGADTAEISANALWGINSSKSSEAADYGMKSGAASKLPNKYGLYDMSGSCSEWTSSPLASSEYNGDAIIDPKPTTAAADTCFMSRGGNWGNDASYLRSACRVFATANYFYWYLGFRTVREVR